MLSLGRLGLANSLAVLASLARTLCLVLRLFIRLSLLDLTGLSITLTLVFEYTYSNKIVLKMTDFHTSIYFKHDLLKIVLPIEILLFFEGPKIDQTFKPTRLLTRIKRDMVKIYTYILLTYI